jgi:hypothetical protein
MNTMAGNAMGPQPGANSNSGGGGIGGFISGLFGMGSSSNAPAQAPRTQMRGPSNVDDILRDFQQQSNDNDRLEVMSTISESEISEMHDDGSVSGLFPTTSSKNGKRGSAGGPARRTLNI